MNIKELFSFQKKEVQTDYSVELSFPLKYKGETADFAFMFVKELYRRILTDCFNHAADFPEDKQTVLWDSVLSYGTGKGAKGLISLLAHAMASRLSNVYLVLDKDVVRPATDEEKKAIKGDVLKKGTVCLSFSDFKQATVLLVLASLVECLLENANAGLNISRSVLIQINNLRESVSSLNAPSAIAQAKAIKDGLKDGKGALLDAADKVTVPTFDTDPLESALETIYGLMSFFTGLPRAYVAGVLTHTLNGSGEGDERATEQGLRVYFSSIFKPVCDQLLGVSLSFKTSDWRKFAEIANLLPVLKATSAVPQEYKDKLIKEIFG
ncbi:hypothetical protein [Candidatus Avelusimicrobium fimicolum]|uniref:hypothetical protein n=1 Tax=Candidatus Avelusimicrobium fimicolum TaxID=3416216 RepID=UPI003D0A6C43